MKRKTYEYLGFRLTLRGWAVRLGIPVDILRLRLEKGWSVERAFGTPPQEAEFAPAQEAFENRKAANRKRTKGKVIEYGGERRTVAEWSKKLGIPRVTIDKRLRNGWTAGQCLGLEPVKRDYLWRCRKLSWKGETLTTREWADRLGISLTRFDARLKSGLSGDALFARNRRSGFP